VTLIAFLLIGGIWAAFLLPSFFAGRRRGPLNTTRNFARSKDLLASVTGVNAGEVKARRRAAARRKRVLVALGSGAVFSLALAVYQSSLTWLAVTIGFDLLFAGYVTLLLKVRGHGGRTGSVIPLITVEREEDTQHHTVRVVAG
jgi:hypothetical protein